MRYRSSPYTTLQRSLQQCGRRVAESARALAFWTSVCLPLGYLLFVAVPSVPPTLLAPLVAVHACSLVLGHTYAPNSAAGGV